MLSWTLRICAIILSLTLFYASWDGVAENRAFEAQGVQALVEPPEGYTVNITTTTNLGVEVNRTERNSAKLSFTTRDGRRVTVNRVLPDEVLAAFRSGSDVFVEYLAEEPTTTRFLGHASKPLFPALLGLLVVALTRYFWRKM
ncbi:MAG: hypothetical protein K8S21_01910 [Gemmatimonadetes bacterium]|nr:hypothetical protein [Gemmatimonadota bacterium]